MRHQCFLGDGNLFAKAKVSWKGMATVGRQHCGTAHVTMGDTVSAVLCMFGHNKKDPLMQGFSFGCLHSTSLRAAASGKAHTMGLGMPAGIRHFLLPCCCDLHSVIDWQLT